MSDKINGRTPEEIKRGLECCSVDGLSCSNCSYCVSCDADIHALERDALAYIQQLERERDAAVAETESLRAEIDAINEDYLSGIHTVRESAQPKWISVEERLPGDPDDVVGEVVEILIEKGGNILCVVVGFYDHQEKHWVVYDGLYTPDVCDGCYAVVRKWMPLPEPPKEET